MMRHAPAGPFRRWALGPGIDPAVIAIAVVATASFGHGAEQNNAEGQTAPPPHAAPQSRETDSTAPSETAIEPASELPSADRPSIITGPLLREGSYLVDARGSVMAKDGGPLWIFVPQSELSDAARLHEMILLPCSLLGELQRIVRSLPGEDLVFQMTGQLTVYKGRNFLLPTSAPRLIGYAPSMAESPNPDEPATSNAAQDQAGGRSANDAEQQLQRALGDMARSVSSPAAPSIPAGQPGVLDSRGPTLSSDLREGAILTARRGSITRDSGGAWAFVLDADASGLADPPLILLPCLLLEKIETFARKSGVSAPVLMSGRVYQYEGRRYLLPTAYRVPKEQSRLQP